MMPANFSGVQLFEYSLHKACGIVPFAGVFRAASAFPSHFGPGRAGAHPRPLPVPGTGFAGVPARLTPGGSPCIRWKRE